MRNTAEVRVEEWIVKHGIGAYTHNFTGQNEKVQLSPYSRFDMDLYNSVTIPGFQRYGKYYLFVSNRITAARGI
jgi:hypothetical protein